MPFILAFINLIMPADIRKFLKPNPTPPVVSPPDSSTNCFKFKLSKKSGAPPGWGAVAPPHRILATVGKVLQIRPKITIFQNFRLRQAVQ
jgi:hypothetical protein